MPCKPTQAKMDKRQQWLLEMHAHVRTCLEPETTEELMTACKYEEPLDYITSIYFQESLFVVVSSRVTSNYSDRIIFRNSSGVHLLPHLFRCDDLRDHYIGNFWVNSYRKNFMSITSDNSRGINFVILAFQMVLFCCAPSRPRCSRSTVLAWGDKVVDPLQQTAFCKYVLSSVPATKSWHKHWNRSGITTVDDWDWVSWISLSFLLL